MQCFLLVALSASGTNKLSTAAYVYILLHFKIGVQT